MENNSDGRSNGVVNTKNATSMNLTGTQAMAPAASSFMAFNNSSCNAMMSNMNISGGGGGGSGRDGGSNVGSTGANGLMGQFNNEDESTAAFLEQYEYDMDKVLNDNVLAEKEQINQRLFQLFQTSACAVAQMFKDKSTASQTSASPQAQLTAWQSFQNSAGAITVLYKESLESCKVHYDLGISMGQQRKLKEILNWLKKKKRRTIRKDELISVLIGKQLGGANSSITPSSGTSASSLFSPNTNGFLSGGQCSQTLFQQQPMSGMSMLQQQPGQFASSTFPKQQLFAPRQQQPPTQQQQTQSQQQAASTNLINGDTSSDLATFREALIMHNRSRDVPLSHSQSATHLQNYTNHSHNHTHGNSTNTNPNTNAHFHAHPHVHNHPQSQQQQPSQAACDDLDCFFCEQIATHIEHKRNASNLNNFDMESPTRKRSRFY